MVRQAILSALPGGQPTLQFLLRVIHVIHENPADWSLFDDTVVDVANPGVGNFITISPPLNRDFELVLFRLQFKADANPADRFIYFSCEIESYETILSFCPTAIVAGEQWNITFAQGIQPSSNADIKFQVAPLPCRLRWQPNDIIRIRALNMQPNDYFQTIRAKLNMQIKTNM